ncbi:Hydantoinase/oxoprolinase-domain-containing protein [Aspergillus cavernicola]|uniref:Hydantoinase/oxoprolinase-domain-containing protein n=1 Tax=Aspergillus cavernicola TaxID=176166 RepID=A0ABR4J2R2_9EURO
MLDGYRLGADVGGTFTDVYAFTPDGQVARAKVPTTVEDQSIGIKNGIRKVQHQLKERYSWDGKFQFIHHGTTVATNAVLEGKGARTGLIVTAGHKDILAVRRSQIPGGLGAWLHYTPPEPIVPLERVIQCQERMSVDGKTVVAVDTEALRAELEKAWVGDQRPEAVAISLLNSHCNSEHETMVADVVRDVLGSDLTIISSSDVLREVGEYERTVTTCTNALVKPVVQTYLSNLQDLLADDGNTIRILKSDGGLTSLDLAGELPVNILMSGPAGGVQGVADVVTRNTPYKNLITFDMGGTSTDCALIYQGKPQLRRETVVGELTVRSPAVDIRTVGAGGGSIANYMDITETMRVGPESAGASPGPACYQKGGKDATVTDANLVLGYLPENLLGGEFTLDVKAAWAAVGDIAEQMKLPVTQTAEDIINLVNETMYGALRLVSVEQGYDPKEFALVAFGGAGPLHANSVGKLLGAWPVIVPPSPGTLCALGDATTRLRHSQSSAFIRLFSATTPQEVKGRFDELEEACRETMQSTNANQPMQLNISHHLDLRYRGQALNLTVDLEAQDLLLEDKPWRKLLQAKFDQLHEQQFKYCLPNFELELMRLEVVAVDASPSIDIPRLSKAETNDPPADALVSKKQIVIEGQTLEAALWDREKVSREGVHVDGPCIITETDSNTLILPGCYGEIDSVGNILIRPSDDTAREQPNDTSAEAALETVQSTPLIPTLVASALASIRSEMDTLMLRCSMSPAIREQQDEFNVITTADGKMLVGQFGSFITQFLGVWKGTIEEGDVFITNDTYMIEGAVTHLNDVIVLLPIFYEHRLIGWASQFGHLTDVGGIVPGSMSINATSIFDDGVQIPCIKLYAKGAMNTDLVTLLCRNSRQPDWYRSDLMAIIAACRTASSRVCELVMRFGCEIYLAACSELLLRNRTAMGKIIDTDFDEQPCTFTDFVDDDGHGIGPWALVCTMKKIDGNKRLLFDWSGTSPQSDHSINFYLSETMFKMFIGYYMIAAAAPGTVINDGFHDLIDIHIPQGSILKPVRPAPISCRTHLMGRTMDVMQALIGKKNPVYAAAAGFSDSPHFFYSGYKPDGEWYQLYQIGFGGVPARNAGDGLDCHCLFPAIKSIPTEIIELNYPLRIEVNESVPDSGGPGFYRGGNAQRTHYRFLSRGEFSLHDDRWFTKPWGIRSGKPGSRSKKVLYRYSKSGDPGAEILPSKCDYIRVDPGDLLEWVTWGGGGLGDPLTRAAEKVALDVRRRLVTINGAHDNYGVVVNPDDLSLNETETEALRKTLIAAHDAVGKVTAYDRGGSLAELKESCLKETGLPAPSPQWEAELYGPHMSLPYVKEWYARMNEVKGWELT